MKITKEKIIYFLSLNLILNLVLLPFTGYMLFELGKHTRVPFVLFVYIALILIFLNLVASIIYFIYSYFVKERFKILHISAICGITVPICLIIFLLLINFEMAWFEFRDLFFYGFLICFIFSLIVLKITAPLRRKIKW